MLQAADLFTFKSTPAPTADTQALALENVCLSHDDFYFDSASETKERGTNEGTQELTDFVQTTGARRPSEGRRLEPEGCDLSSLSHASSATVSALARQRERGVPRRLRHRR